MYTGTYSPEDNKLRLYAVGRLDADTYARVRAAGFIWAPKQGLFVAPAWSPAREDLLIDVAGSVDDEDKSLVERAEERAERFDDYSDKRTADALRAKEAVDAIADGIPFGQPILVGHHSQRHAERDARKIEDGMRRAVRMWDTAAYWTQRAAGAIRHAKYKELPAVRARRIKGIEADRRKRARAVADCEHLVTVWNAPGLTRDRALAIAAHDNVSKRFTLAEFPRVAPASQYEGMMSLWSAMNDNVCTFEQAREIAVRVHRRTIEAARRWVAHFDNRLAYERAMMEECGGTVADRTKPERGGAVRCWCSPRGGWSIITKVNRVSVSVLDNWGNGGRDFKRIIPMHDLHGVMSKADVDAARAAGRLNGETARGFFLAAEPVAAAPVDSPAPAVSSPVMASAFDAIRGSLAAGVQVVTAPQLFPTPAALAAQVVELASVRPGDRVLEPSAGTGNLLDALPAGAQVMAVEIVPQLAQRLEGRAGVVRAADFLTLGDELGQFDRIVMNPPFENGADIKHIAHARRFLKPGGRLVSICAAGPRQRLALEPLGEWIDLPDDSFATCGTKVRTAIIVIDA